MSIRRAFCVAMASSFAAIGMMANISVANATLITNANLGGPGVYYGSGNSDGHFTITQVGNLQLGQRAITRFIGPGTPVGNVYSFPLGPTGVPGKTGANWGVDFSIYTQAGGGSATLSNYTYRWALVDNANNTSGGFDPLLIPDNAQWGAGKVQCPNVACDATINAGAQNSEAISFAGVYAAFGGIPPFDVNLNDTLLFTLSAYDLKGELVASNTIQVNQGAGAPPAQVPEPPTIALFGAGILGAVTIGTKRRQQRKAVAKAA